MILAVMSVSIAIARTLNYILVSQSAFERPIALANSQARTQRNYGRSGLGNFNKIAGKGPPEPRPAERNHDRTLATRMQSSLALAFANTE